jgi:spore germination protein YaaH
MKKFKTPRATLLALILFLFCSGIPGASFAAEGEFSDIPADSWARDVITSARDYGLIDGIGEGLFGYGRTITRAEFVTIICRMFAWELISPPQGTFSDVANNEWYYPYAETALAHGVVDPAGTFSPGTPILRSEMAVMLVKALGYGGSFAEQIAKFGPPPFSDVTRDQGYISIAYDIGMIQGVSASSFAPDNTATREEAGAMLVRVYEKYKKKTDWLHGFYAFSSYEQRNVIRDTDAVSFGWSAMEWDAQNGARLSTSAAGGNRWSIPDGYGAVTEYAAQSGAKAHLSVYMDAADGALNELLRRADARDEAVAAIVDEVTRPYEAIGKSPYSGVTIDFEGLRGSEIRSAYTTFLTDLSAELKSRNLSLYVTVQPAMEGGYFDGYDYRAIGRLADKIILMAHDYNPASLEGFVGTEWQKNAALTPIASVYYALRAITDPQSGVEDRSRVVLALSFSSAGWQITEDGRVASAEAVHPAIATIRARMSQSDAVLGWSEVYRNPYITYGVETGEKYFVWYEDARSVGEKLRLARLFDISGASVWRIGTIPDYPETYDVWTYILSQR